MKAFKKSLEMGWKKLLRGSRRMLTGFFFFLLILKLFIFFCVWENFRQNLLRYGINHLNVRDDAALSMISAQFSNSGVFALK